ncbi:M20/M25/M40 family metallo-hydrolase [Aquirufa nivalisilvae]|uniref:M20/M25/M40 family metallo-hydrolase n=1 Tax=Aquirufa nivalisilvae TaxID=2516557 RepID=UPI001032ACE0|nr:M20/M25/M40 family metallo-hydrolase [Aquirufa nivalisilvae]TBH76220.1 M20/M25/M40 family metallo-hydrolase [Aquirufa nivalisilvae]
MRKTSLLLVGLLCSISALGQSIDKIIHVKEVERIERYLASDELAGRKPFTPGIEKAAQFISDEFAKSKLKTWGNSSSYLQTFQVYKPTLKSIKASLNGEVIDAKKVVVIGKESKTIIQETSSYAQATIAKGENLFQSAYRFISGKTPTVVWVDEDFANLFTRLSNRNILRGNQVNVAFILSSKAADKFSIEVENEITPMSLSNVVGIIPGKSLANEYVIFSGHYDHLGVMPNRAVKGDSIYNGANDDAAGTTGMMMLAKYFKKWNKNERTLVFAAFTAEESGGFGASYFSEQFDPASVKAMFNLEMIGTESKWGKNSAYITGFEKTDMGAILQKNLEGTGFTFHPDPYTEENLFYRSDNAALARLGVPAHTISTSKMDNEPNYHKPSDQIETLDLENMTAIIKSIAFSAQTIISGKDTPSRVDTSQLK